jgi:arylsulfatase
MRHGKLRYVYNYVGSSFYRVESGSAVPAGRHQLRFEFEVTGKPDIPNGKGAPGRGQLYIDGKLAGAGDIPETMPLCLGLGGGIMCGADTGAAVAPDYKPPFKFTGTLYSVTVDVSGELIQDKENKMRIVMARQ